MDIAGRRYRPPPPVCYDDDGDDYCHIVTKSKVLVGVFSQVLVHSALAVPDLRHPIGP